MRTTPARQLFSGPLNVRAAIRPDSFNAEARTFQATLSAGSPVVRRPMFEDPFVERLEITAGSVRLDRLNNGAPLVIDHGEGIRDVVGVIERAWVEGTGDNAVVAIEARFSERADVAPIARDVETGILRNLSTRYQVHAWRVTEATEEGEMEQRTAADWEPWEGSLVAMGADDLATVRSHPTTAGHAGETYTATRQGAADSSATGDPETMPTPNNPNAVNAPTAGATSTPAPAGDSRGATNQATPTPEVDIARVLAAARTEERERIHGIETTARVSGLEVSDPFVRNLVSGQAGQAPPELELARAAIIDEAALRQAVAAPASNGTHAARGVEVIAEEGALVRAGIQEALDARSGAIPDKGLSAAGRAFRGLTMIEMARELAETSGLTRAEARSMSRMELATRALHGTSDFPLLLGNTFNRRLLAAFDAQPRTFLPLASQNNAPDFKTITALHLGGMSVLEEVDEHGEFKSASMGEKGETYILHTYGNVMGFTRQAMVNDDLGGFSRLTRQAGRSAGTLENNLAWALITGNVTMSDGNALFDAGNHGNNQSGATSPLSLASLAIAFQQMMEQRDTAPRAGELGDFLNIAPATLAVPPDLVLVAKQLLRDVEAAVVTNANVFAQDIRNLIIEPRLGVQSAVEWYAFADPASVDVLEYAYLDGQTGPTVEQLPAGKVDGVEFKIRHDFAIAPLHWVGAHKSDGI